MPCVRERICCHNALSSGSKVDLEAEMQDGSTKMWHPFRLEFKLWLTARPLFARSPRPVNLGAPVGNIMQCMQHDLNRILPGTSWPFSSNPSRLRLWQYIYYGNMLRPRWRTRPLRGHAQSDPSRRGNHTKSPFVSVVFHHLAGSSRCHSCIWQAQRQIQRDPTELPKVQARISYKKWQVVLVPEISLLALNRLPEAFVCGVDLCWKEFGSTLPKWELLECTTGTFDGKLVKSLSGEEMMLLRASKPPKPSSISQCCILQCCGSSRLTSDLI